MQTTESHADLDLRVRAHVLANPALYKQAGKDIDETYSPQKIWEADIQLYKAQAGYPPERYPTLEQWQSPAKRIKTVFSEMLDHYRHFRGIPPVERAARAVLVHWVLTDESCNTAPVELTEFQDWSKPGGADHELMHSHGYDRANNTEWREYVYKSLAVMQSQAAAKGESAKPKQKRKRRRAATEPKALTDRERQAVELAAEGHGPTEIGKRMGVTKSTAATLRDKGKKKLYAIASVNSWSSVSVRPTASIKDVQYSTKDD